MGCILNSRTSELTTSHYLRSNDSPKNNEPAVYGKCRLDSIVVLHSICCLSLSACIPVLIFSYQTRGVHDARAPSIDVPTSARHAESYFCTLSNTQQNTYSWSEECIGGSLADEQLPHWLGCVLSTLNMLVTSPSIYKCPLVFHERLVSLDLLPIQPKPRRHQN